MCVLAKKLKHTLFDQPVLTVGVVNLHVSCFLAVYLRPNFGGDAEKR